VPLEFPDQKYFEAACGYMQLGLFLEANEELENIDPFNRGAPEILALRVEIYSALGKWDLMTEVARVLVEFEPNEPQWRVSFAYATRRFESLEAARDILLVAESKFPNEAVIKYNLGCYAAVMGDLQGAKEYLKRCFAIDLEWRVQALEDQDLQPLWDSISQKSGDLETPDA
jgi:tetratricopeptide (TPR) repeat protein